MVVLVGGLSREGSPGCFPWKVMLCLGRNINYFPQLCHRVTLAGEVHVVAPMDNLHPWDKAKSLDHCRDQRKRGIDGHQTEHLATWSLRASSTVNVPFRLHMSIFTQYARTSWEVQPPISLSLISQSSFQVPECTHQPLPWNCSLFSTWSVYLDVLFALLLWRIFLLCLSGALLRRAIIKQLSTSG